MPTCIYLYTPFYFSVIWQIFIGTKMGISSFLEVDIILNNIAHMGSSLKRTVFANEIFFLKGIFKKIYFIENT